MKKLSFLTAWAVLLLAAVSCGNPPESSELKFETITAEDSDGQGVDYSIRFTYPSGYGDKAVLDTLQRKFITHVLGEQYASLAPREAVDALVADWKRQYAEDTEGMGDAPEYVLSYRYSVSDTILFASDTLLQLHAEFFEYGGGAHGMGGSSSHLFNLQTGGEYTQADIFKPESAETVRSLIIPEILIYRGAQTVYDVDAGGEMAWIDNLWTETTNFALTPDGIWVTYSDYEISSYAFGRPDMTIPYVRIFPCLREGTPVWDVAKAAAEEGGIGDSEPPAEMNEALLMQIYYQMPASAMPDGLKTEEQRRKATVRDEDSNILSSVNEESSVLSCTEHLGDGQYITWEMAAYPTIDPQRILLIVRLGECFDGCAFPVDKTLLYHTGTGELTEIKRPMEPPTAEELIDESDFGSAELAAKARACYSRKPALTYRELRKDGFSVNFDAFEFWGENNDYDYYNADFVILHYKWDGIRFVKSGATKAREE